MQSLAKEEGLDEETTAVCDLAATLHDVQVRIDSEHEALA